MQCGLDCHLGNINVTGERYLQIRAHLLLVRVRALLKGATG